MSSVTWPRAVVFDLDGTLVDSAPDIATSINMLLEQDGLASFSLTEVTSFIGHGIRRLVERAYAVRGIAQSEADLTAKVEAFQAIYIKAIADKTQAYPGALTLIADLKKLGIKIGICTNKAEPLTQALLVELEIRPLFDAIVGGQAAIAPKPAADMLLETLRRLDCAPEDAVMVGDSSSDVACARAAQVAVVGVTFGYTDVPMRELRPDAIIDHFDDAFEALRSLQQRPH